MAEVGKEVPLVDLVAQVSPNGDPLMSAEGRQYLNNFKVTGEKGKYQISFNGIDLGYFLKEKEHVIVTMNSIGHALILHKSCQARYEHSNTIKKALADCSFVTEEPLLGEWRMNVAIDDSLFIKSNVMTEAQFQRAFAYLTSMGHRKVTGWISDTKELYRRWDEFANFMNIVTSDESLAIQNQQFAEK